MAWRARARAAIAQQLLPQLACALSGGHALTRCRRATVALRAAQRRANGAARTAARAIAPSQPCPSVGSFAGPTRAKRSCALQNMRLAHCRDGCEPAHRTER